MNFASPRPFISLLISVLVEVEKECILYSFRPTCPTIGGVLCRLVAVHLPSDLFEIVVHEVVQSVRLLLLGVAVFLSFDVLCCPAVATETAAVVTAATATRLFLYPQTSSHHY